MGEKELEVLAQYEIDVKSTKKVRGAILCDTKQGLFLLREISCSEKRLPILYELQRSLKQNGYGNVDIILKNKDGACYSESEEGTRYILKHWFGGRECDIQKEADILQGVCNLARLHQVFFEKESEYLTQKESLELEFFRHNREMKKVRSFIREKVGKGEFELTYLKYFDEMFEWALRASECLKQSSYCDLQKQAQSAMTMVHGDYNYHNILMTSSGIATTNFEHFYQGIQVDDLYYFLRKTMEKNQWSIPLGNKMLESYNRIKPISEEELSYIAINMAYPEKFWKAANSYYRSRKSWIPAKSLEKLQLAIKQTEEKRKFLETVFGFYL